MIIFVYGTLRRGNLLSCYLQRAEFIGEAQTVCAEFRMFCNGSYPYVIRVEDGYKISGELYRVDSDLLECLDEIEYSYKRHSTLLMCEGREVSGELYLVTYRDYFLKIREVTSGNWEASVSIIGRERYFSESSE